MNSANVHAPADLRAARTRESLCAEEAYRSRAPAERPLAAHRLSHASALYDTLRAFDVSKLRFAEMLGVHEKQIRKMLEGLTPIQSTVIAAMPADMALDFLARLEGLRVGSKVSRMRREVERLRREEDLASVYEAQRQLLELAGELATRGK